MRSQSIVVALVALSTGAFAAPLDTRAVEVGKTFVPRDPAGGLGALLAGLGGGAGGAGAATGNDRLDALIEAQRGAVGDALVNAGLGDLIGVGNAGGGGGGAGGAGAGGAGGAGGTATTATAGGGNGKKATGLTETSQASTLAVGA